MIDRMRPCARLLCPAIALATAATLGCGSSDGGGSCSLAPAQGVPSSCANPVGQSVPTAATQAIPLGTLQVGQSAQFQVPANTASITIVEQAVSAPATITYSDGTLDNSAVPIRILDPAGGVVYDDTVVAPVGDPVALPQRKAYFGASAPAAGTMTIPNTTTGLGLIGPQGLAPGTWTVTVSDYAYLCTRQCCSGGSTASRYDVTVVLKSTTAGQIPAGGNLDVTVWFATQNTSVAGRPLSAATANAGGDPDLKRMEATLRTVLARGGITVRSVTYQDLNASLPPSLAAAANNGIDIDQTGPCSPLSQLFAYAQDGNRLNVFFVASMITNTLGHGQSVVGVDGTVPGPSTIAGSSASGVGVSTEDLRAGSGRAVCAGGITISCGADETAYIIAHEAGHYLGLYHTTEGNGTAFDPLSDTPSCACSACRPSSAAQQCSTSATGSSSDYLMTGGDCSRSSTCGGGDNLMFWLLDSTSQGSLTPEQGRVMRANPLVQ